MNGRRPTIGTVEWVGFEPSGARRSRSSTCSAEAVVVAALGGVRRATRSTPSHTRLTSWATSALLAAALSHCRFWSSRRACRTTAVMADLATFAASFSTFAACRAAAASSLRRCLHASRCSTSAAFAAALPALTTALMTACSVARTSAGTGSTHAFFAAFITAADAARARLLPLLMLPAHAV